MSEEERYFAKGREQLSNELDIVELVRKIRRLEAVVKNLAQKVDQKDSAYIEA